MDMKLECDDMSYVYTTQLKGDEGWRRSKKRVGRSDGLGEDIGCGGALNNTSTNYCSNSGTGTLSARHDRIGV
jgi:hypothetical protein